MMTMLGNPSRVSGQMPVPPGSRPQRPDGLGNIKAVLPLAPGRAVRPYWANLAIATSEASRRTRRALLCAAVFLLGLAGAISARADLGTAPEIVSVEPVELLTDDELATLVAPVALYPDDLLAIVLPASTFPLQVVLAARFLEASEADLGLEPDDEWDASVVALLNYPEIVALLDSELRWTWQLGEAVLLQQEDVIDAVAGFREQAAAAGNLKSDDKQVVSVSEAGAIEIAPVEREVIYVPYYDPEEVVTYQPRRVYNYYPRAYPVYYYPYPSGHYFSNGAFWGVTSAFSIGWYSRSLHWHHYGFQDHPYFGYSYYDPFYYRRPHVRLSFYRQDRPRRHDRRHHDDNRWHNDDRRGGSRPGRRPGRPGAGSRPDGSDGRSPGGRDQAAPPGAPAARGIERSVVAMPDKRSGHIPVNRTGQRGDSRARKTEPARTRTASTARLAAASRRQSSNAPAELQSNAPRRHPPVGAVNAPNARAANLRRAIEQRAAERSQRPATRPAPGIAQQPGHAANRNARAPLRLLRQQPVKPAESQAPPRISTPIRKPSNMERPAVSPRQPAQTPTPRRTRPAAVKEPAKRASPRVQQGERRRPSASSLSARLATATRANQPAALRRTIASPPQNRVRTLSSPAVRTPYRRPALQAPPQSKPVRSTPPRSVAAPAAARNFPSAAIQRNAAKPASRSVQAPSPRSVSARPPAVKAASNARQRHQRQSSRRRPER